MKIAAPFAASLALAVVTAVPAAGADAPACPGRVLPDNLLVETLDNGVQVVIEERHATPLVHVRALMRIGGLYEGEYLGCGLSHWMEHIVAGGSTRREEVAPDGTKRWVGRTEDENKDLFRAMGGNRNASTSHDFTNYFVTTRADMVETAIDVTADCLQHCQFDPVEVAREQRVVQQELLRNEDDPGRLRAQLFAETAFRVHPARVPVIGYVDAIQRVTREDMTRFYELHYTPQNCVVAITGDVDKREALELVRRHFGAWKRKPLAPYQIPDEPPQTGPRWVEKAHGATKTCLVMAGVPTIPLLHEDLHALDMASFVLGVSASARLPRKFEHDPKREVLASGVSSSNYTPQYGAGRFIVAFGADTPEHARQLVGEIWAEAVRLREELVTPEEMARARTSVESHHLQSRADLEDRAQTLAHDLAWLSDPLFSDRYLEALAKVTPEQVRDAARRWLRDDRLNVVIVTPPQPPAEATATAEREAEGEVKKVTLDNGLTLLVKRVPDFGMVDVVATFHGGVIHEDDATNGLFLLMSSTFWRGTKGRPFPDLLRTLDELGMDLSAESANNSWQVKMHATSKRFERAFDVMADVLREPAIDAAWVDQGKRQVLDRVLPNLAVNPTETMSRVLRETLYTEGPYRRQRFGTKETVASFDAAKVRALYDRYARPNNLVLAVYGDVDPAAVEAQVRRRFGDWARGEVPASFARDDKGPVEGRTVELKNRQIRTNYGLAWRAYSRQQEAERAGLAVMNAMFGGQGWLHARLREGKADYVYAVSSSPFPGDRAGHFQITTDFSPQDEAIVLGIIDGAVADMRAGKFTDKELAAAKDMMMCWEALQKASNADVVAGDAVSELFGQGYDHDAKWFARLKGVTREDVVRAANEVFSRPAVRVLIRPEATASAGAAK
jgi:zinc protease